jgi:hypothetical protein
MNIDNKHTSPATASGKARTTALLFPFLDLKAQHADIREEVLEAVHRVLKKIK